MRRILRRTFGGTGGGGKRRSLGARERIPVTLVTAAGGDDGFHAAAAYTERPPVPEPGRDADEDQDERVQGENMAVDGRQKSRSLPRNLDERSDSGCSVRTESTAGGGGDGRRRRRRKALERQDGLVLSDTSDSAVVSPSSLTKSLAFERFRRQRTSLRSFRDRSGRYLRRQMRPSCLRRRDSDEADGAYGVSVSVAAVDVWFSAASTHSVEGDCDGRTHQWLSGGEDGAARSARSQQSSTTMLSSIDAPVWSDHVSSSESPTSAFSTVMFNDQVSLGVF